MDFLKELPQEIKENIFKYLNLTDILNLSLSSKYLNNSIGQSKCCMRKIWIKFYSFNLKDLESLNESARRYEKLKINRVNRDDHFEYLINLTQSNWRKVLIYNCEFKKFETFYKLISLICDKIEELEISDIEILSYQNYENSLKFPLLKRFMFRNMPLKAIELFAKSESLENAAFDIVTQVSDGRDLHKITYKILNSSSRLRQLQLGPQYIKALFGEQDKNFNFPFKLQNLLLKFSIVNDLPEFEFAGENISTFLTHQSSVKWLIFMELQNDTVLTTAWNSMPHLQHISFVGLEELFGNSEMTFDINLNLKLTQLDLISRKVLISQLRKFLKSAPHLQILHLKTVNKHMMEFIAKNHANIHTLFYEHVDEDAMELYEKLKILNEEELNRNITLIQKSFWFNQTNPFSLDPTFWRVS